MPFEHQFMRDGQSRTLPLLVAIEDYVQVYVSRAFVDNLLPSQGLLYILELVQKLQRR